MSPSILLAQYAWLAYFFIGLLSACIGSFLNVVVYRLPIMLEHRWNDTQPKQRFDLLLPRSTCPKCNTLIAWWQNIPMLSFLWLKRRCAHCKTTIPFRYFLGELATTLLSLLLLWHFGITLALAGALLFTWMLIPLVLIDLEHQLLPDDITLPLLWVGLLINLSATFTTLPNAVIGAVSGYVFLWLLTYGYKAITGKIGMGHGDFKLFAALGAWFGWQSLAIILFLASLAGSIIGITWLIWRKRSSQTPIPFGPFLAIAGWLMLFFPQLMSQWLS